jgi:hypothetical protein
MNAECRVAASTLAPQSRAGRQQAAGTCRSPPPRGKLDETHWLELKREIPTTKGSNAELARDLASLAVDGGLLIIGIEEVDLGRVGAIVGTDLAGLAERVDAIARSRVDPPLASALQ